MTDSTNEEDLLLSPKDMQAWLQIEITSTRLAGARRIAEAKNLVDSYGAGQISSSEANLRLGEHEKKWGRGAADVETGEAIHEAAVTRVLRQRKVRSIER